MPAPPSWKQMWDALALRVTRLEQRMNNVLAHTGLSVPAQGVTQVDGNLNVANMGRATFDGGSLIMLDGHGQQFAYVGDFTSVGYGMSLTRLDGSTALLFADNDPTTEQIQTIGLYDRNGYAVAAEDLTGAGARWPLAPIQFEDLTWSNWSYNSSATFTAVQQAVHFKSSPRIYFTGQAVCDGTATGEVRLMCNGTQIGSTTSLANLTMTGLGFGTPATLPGAVGDPLTLTLETRVTGGAGKVYAKALTAMAWPS